VVRLLSAPRDLSSKRTDWLWDSPSLCYSVGTGPLSFRIQGPRRGDHLDVVSELISDALLFALPVCIRDMHMDSFGVRREGRKRLVYFVNMIRDLAVSPVRQSGLFVGARAYHALLFLPSGVHPFIACSSACSQGNTLEKGSSRLASEGPCRRGCDPSST
jgi:hypothetical protein